MRGTAKRDQSIRKPAIAALAIVIGLGWLYSRSLRPPPVHLVKCAAVEGSPCFPDPGMQRLGFPQPLPFDVPHPVEVGPPQFGPSR